MSSDVQPFSQGTVTCTRCLRHVDVLVTIVQKDRRVCDPAHKTMGASCERLTRERAVHRRSTRGVSEDGS